MSKYRCVTRCPFAGEVWNAGDEVEFAPSIKPPKHFVPIDDSAVPAAEEVIETEPYIPPEERARKVDAEAMAAAQERSEGTKGKSAKK